MKIEIEKLSPQECYRLISGIVVPRPIAWISTKNEHGTVNLAPFSCFTFVSNTPLMIGVNIGRKAGKQKDTARLIQNNGEFVVNVADWSMVESVHLSAVEYDSHESEAEMLGLSLERSHEISTPRLAEVPVSLECRLHTIIPFGETGAEFFVGQVALAHVRDELYVNGKIDSVSLHPVCRIAGANYATLGEVRQLAPVAQTPKSRLKADSRGS